MATKLASMLPPIRLDEDAHRELERIAETDRRTVAFVVREAIDEYVARVSPGGEQEA